MPKNIFGGRNDVCAETVVMFKKVACSAGVIL